MPSTSTRDKLRSWIHKQVFNNGEAAPVKLALFHVTVGKYGGRVGTYPLPPQYDDATHDTGAAIEHVADEILRDAEHDNQSVSEVGNQSYAVISLSESDEHIGRFPFRAQPRYDTVHTESETADAKGIIHQLMRHNETREKTSNQMLGTMMAYMTRVIESVQDENNRMADERLKVMELTQNLLNQQQDRDIKMLEHEAKQENIQELMGNVKLLLPAIASKLTGSAATVTDGEGEKIDPKGEAMKRFAASLSPEQMQTIQATLSPAQLMALMEVIPQE